ncbi:MAG: hypothetical protein IKK53_07260 [Ruminiclostridium sp.]|nr:hypothetical protein [Ruminiclostridium sp.]
MSSNYIVLRKSRIKETTLTLFLIAVIVSGAVFTLMSQDFIRPDLYSLFSAFIIPFAIMTASDCLMRIKQTPKRLSLAIIVSQAVLISGFFCYNYLCAVDGGGFMGLTQVSHIVIAVITAHLIYLSVLLLLQIVVINRFIQKLK